MVQLSTTHQTWLDYGPSVKQVRAACADVRQIVSDMGTEMGIETARLVILVAYASRRSGVRAPILMVLMAQSCRS